MACANNSDVDDLVTCGVCYNEFDAEDNKPKLLQCLHTICFQCLKKIYKNGSITCPFCRDVFVKDISAISSISDALQKLKIKEKKVEESVGNLRSSTVKQIPQRVQDDINLAAEKKLSRQLFELVSKTLTTVSVKEYDPSGVDLNRRDEEGMTSLIQLMLFSNGVEKVEEIARRLIENGADVNARDKDGKTALYYICKFYQKDNLIDIVKLLIENGADVNASYIQRGLAPLHCVCINHSEENLIEIIRFLIRNGAHVNAKSVVGRTALLYACLYPKKNLIETIRVLIENGAEVNDIDEDGISALFYVCMRYKEENLIDIIRLFIQNGVDFKAEGQITLLYLFQFYNKEHENLLAIIRLMLENGADVNVKDNDGITALHFLCKNYKKENFIEMIRLLIEYGADVNAKDVGGWTALDYARKYYNNNNNKNEILRLLRTSENWTVRKPSNNTLRFPFL